MLHSYNPLVDIKIQEKNAKCLESFVQKVNSGRRIFYILENMFNYNWHPRQEETDFRPTISDAIEILENLMAKLNAAQDGQTFAFITNHASNVYWHKRIAAFGEFKFLKQGSDRIGPDTKSILFYDQLLPFNNANHSDHKCVAGKDLPDFYKYKEKE